MDLLRIETLGMRPKDPVAASRAEAVEVAKSFEQLFVRSLVASMRSTAAMGGEGGMFGSGPGADTYADWFDGNVATEVAGSGRVGIAEAVIADLERHKEIPVAEPRPKAVRHWRPLDEKPAMQGGIDGLH